MRTGNQCVYRAEVDLLFHDETAHATARAERMWLARANQESCDDRTVTSGNHLSRDSYSRSCTPAPSKELHLSLEDLAVARFVHDYVVASGDRSVPFGYFDFLPRVYCTNKVGSSINTAIEAVALANFSRRCHLHSDVTTTAATRYGKALALTHAALRDPVTMLSHETVLSCHLLGLYEVRRAAAVIPVLVANFHTIVGPSNSHKLYRLEQSPPGHHGPTQDARVRTIRRPSGTSHLRTAVCDRGWCPVPLVCDHC